MPLYADAAMLLLPLSQDAARYVTRRHAACCYATIVTARLPPPATPSPSFILPELSPMPPFYLLVHRRYAALLRHAAFDSLLRDGLFADAAMPARRYACCCHIRRY